MAAIDDLIKALTDGDGVKLSLDVVEEIDRDYPFFTLADAVMLQRSSSELTPDVRRHLSERLALNASDPERLFQFVDPAHAEWARFYPDETVHPAAPTTDDAITTFLETYGHSDPASDALLERLIFNPPAPDYLSLLETEQDPALETLNTTDPDIPDFNPELIQQQRAEAEAEPAVKESADEPPHTPTPPPVPVPVPVPVPPPVPDAYRPHCAAQDSSLKESLAKIYIRQGRYDKAFEIYTSISLNNPKKSVYFADQLRFLRKLMLNQQSKD